MTSRRKTSADATSPSKRARSFDIVSPALENNLSTGAEVAGMAELNRQDEAR